ncbi:MAG: SEL1-like repeat protein [Proteobacteria bacterium]|nr:SEL1-like repeat protein [Pseudomonadota bacterium]
MTRSSEHKEKDQTVVIPKPVIMIFYDVDDTTSNNKLESRMEKGVSSNEILFHGSDVKNDPGLWKIYKDGLIKEFGEQVNLQFRVLTARPSEGSNTHTIPQYLALKDIDACTGEEVESKHFNCTYHFPEIFIVEKLTKKTLSMRKIPRGSFIWCKTSGKLYFKRFEQIEINETNSGMFWSVDDDKKNKQIASILKKLGADQGRLSDYLTHPISEQQAAIIESLHENGFYNYCATPEFVGPAGRRPYYNITHSSPGAENYITATHFTPTLPKAVVMSRARTEPWTAGTLIAASILIDDLEHSYFGPKDIWIDASKLKLSSDSKTATIKVLNNLKSKIRQIIDDLEFNPVLLTPTLESILRCKANLVEHYIEIRSNPDSSDTSTRIRCVRKLLSLLAGNYEIFTDAEIIAAKQGKLFKILNRYKQLPQLKSFYQTERIHYQKSFLTWFVKEQPLPPALPTPEEIEQQITLGVEHLTRAQPQQAFEKFSYAANLKDPTGQFYLGYCYRYGIGVEPDEKKAIRYYRLATNRNHILAKYSLDFMKKNQSEQISPELAKALEKLTSKHQHQVKQGFETLQAIHSKQPSAQTAYHLGRCYEQGIGTAKDQKAALGLYESSGITDEYGPALNKLGECYRDGLCGVEIKGWRQLSYFLAAATQGDSAGQHNLAKLYLKRADQAAININKALKFYHLAAAQGNPNSYFDLSVCYREGKGVNKNLVASFNLCALAASQGNVAAQTNLGWYYEHGFVVAKNPKEAVRWYQLGADKGNDVAQFNLALCYYKGSQVYVDLRKMAYLLRLSAEQKHAGAQAWLGYCYEEGVGVEPNQKEAFRLFQLSALQGSATGQQKLANCYRLGKGVAQDQKEAVKLYQLASNQGDACSQRELGDCYRLGLGVEIDIKEAVRLYRLSAEQKDRVAQYCLSKLYYEGNGVIKDLKESALWCRLSADQGYDPAQARLGYYYEAGLGVEQDSWQSILYYELAVRQGNPLAQFRLGYHYQHGIWVSTNLPEARRLYQLAAAQGNKDAQNALQQLTEYSFPRPGFAHS